MAARMRRHSRPIAIDLFCGAGGMTLGFEQAGFDIVFSVDSDGHHVAVHKRNFPTHPTVCQSVIDLTADSIYEAIGGPQEVDLLFGGPPCQGFSSMGLRDSLDPRNSLVGHFVRLVCEVRPKAFVMENVPGMATGSTKPILHGVIEALEEAGYLITKPVRVLDASNFGVPQKRRRLFVLGVRKDAGVRAEYPVGPKDGQPVRPTVLEAIGDLPDVDADDALFNSDSAKYHNQPHSPYSKTARGILSDPTDFSYLRQWTNTECTGCLRIRHTERAVQLYKATPPGTTVPGHKLPRLAPEGLCPTLRAGSDSTHGSYTAPRPIHPLLPRCITAREAARLHGFPDWFALFPTKWHAYRQIGNAVCPQVARAVGFSIMDALGLTPKKPKPVIALGESFDLPDDRPRSLKRIPHVVNYPPVIARLFSQAYDETTEKLIRPRFTFKDVQRAIEATGVNLPWARADKFVHDIARSRNVRAILADCLEKGYSLAPLEGRYIGEFRRDGDPGTITEKDAIDVKSSDLARAVTVNIKATASVLSASALASAFSNQLFTDALWGRGHAIRLGEAVAHVKHNKPVSYTLQNGSAASEAGTIAFLAKANQPTKSRLTRLLKRVHGSEVVAVFPLTGEHILAVRFDATDGSLREVKRCVFQFSQEAGGVEHGKKAKKRKKATT